MQFVVYNVAKVELDSTSATVTLNVARNVPPHVLAFEVLLHVKTFRATCKNVFTRGRVSPI